MVKKYQSCLKCAKTGHMIRDYKNQREVGDHTSRRNTGRLQTNTWWNTGPRIQEMEVEIGTRGEQELGKEEDC